MNPYKLLVLDIDGTVTNSQKVITPKTKDALLRLQESGTSVAIASGRPSHGVAPVADELELHHFGGYILSFNGARIINWQTKECIFSRTLPSGLIRSLARDAAANQVGIVTYSEDQIHAWPSIDPYMEQESRITGMPLKTVENFASAIDFPVNKCLFTGDPQILENMEPVLSEKYLHEAQVFRSEPYFLEVTPKNVDKAYCLERLIRQLGIKREELVCCGDGFNDLSMIQFAGLGVAMANAQEKVKEVADYITLSNDEDGIAHVVDKFFLN